MPWHESTLADLIQPVWRTNEVSTFVRPLKPAARSAFLFPGQGSQRPHMLRELAVEFPDVREGVEQADRALTDKLPRQLSSYIYPPTAFRDEDRAEQQRALTDTHIAQPALGAVEAGVCRLLGRLGVTPDMTAGHSYGEYVALWAAGALGDDALFEISEIRGRAIKESLGADAGTMLAVHGDAEVVASTVAGESRVWIANFNAPSQTVVAGDDDAIEAVARRLNAVGLKTQSIPVACAFHSPLMEASRKRLGTALAKLRWRRPRVPVFSNSLGAAYPGDPAEMAAVLSEHLVRPVRFVDEIRAMYDAGSRLFVEVGPGSTLSGLTRRILDGQDAVAMSVDGGGRTALPQLLRALGQLAVCGVAVCLEPLFRGRVDALLDPARLADEPGTRRRSATWLVNGGRAMPATAQPGAALATSAVEPRPETPVAERPQQADETLAFTGPPPMAGRGEPEVPPPGHPSAESDGDGDRPQTALDARTPPPPVAPSTQVVVTQFQQVMQQFLKTQAAVMTSFLGGGGAQASTSISELAAVLPAEGTLDSSTVATPEDMGATIVQPRTPAPPPVLEPAASDEPARVPTPAAAQDVVAVLVQLTSSRTGYPPDMLDIDADLEADLGVDSIKRVEILGAFQRQSPPAEQDRIRAVMEELNSAKTLRAIGELLGPATEPSVLPDATATPAAEPPETADVSAPLDRLLRTVSDRTGYPIEMLDLDLDLEADLGVDSIKRVEILSTFQRSHAPHLQSVFQEQMDVLTGLKTLRQLAETLAVILSEESEQPPPAGGPSSTPDRASDEPAAPAVPRLTVTTVDAGVLTTTSAVFTDRVSVITDEGAGIADAVARELRSRGERPVLVRSGERPLRVGDGVYETDLTTPETARELVGHIRRDHGPISGILHLAPLRPSRPLAGLAFGAWRHRVRHDVNSLYALVQAARSDLTGQTRDRAFIAAVTGMGGRLGTKPDARLTPTHPGVVAMVKTLALELSVRCKAIDVESQETAGVLAPRVLGEILSGDVTLEVGYQGSRRVTVAPVLSPLNGNSSLEAINSDWVFLLTGGARGITAEVACHLARRFRPTLILAGRAAEPSSPESTETAGIEDPLRLKGAVASVLRRDTPDIRPMAVERAWRELLRAREIRRTLRTIREAGARVVYRQVDVRDDAALAQLVDDLYERFGRLDAVVHGAGVIEDRLIADKTPESFDRVVQTKADSAFVLSRVLRPDQLKVFALMSSVTATFGNRGQFDYAAANGVLNGFAARLSAEWPGRVVALNWGPWDGAGMASPEVRRQFLERGIEPIPPAAGVEAAIVELAGGPWSGSDRGVRERPLGPGRPRSGVGENGVSVERVDAVWRRSRPGEGNHMFDMRRTIALVAIVVACFVALVGQAAAQPPLPAPDPGGLPIIFYGADPPSPPGVQEPDVLIFVHGLGGTADNWWLANNAYQRAFELGYRTAFVELDADASMVDNGTLLMTVIPIIVGALRRRQGHGRRPLEGGHRPTSGPDVAWRRRAGQGRLHLRHAQPGLAAGRLGLWRGQAHCRGARPPDARSIFAADPEHRAVPRHGRSHLQGVGDPVLDDGGEQASRSPAHVGHGHHPKDAGTQ